MNRIKPMTKFLVPAMVLATAGAMAPAQVQSSTRSSTPQELVADQLFLMMQQSLSGSDEPREDQLDRAQILLDLALDLLSDDPDLWLAARNLADMKEDEYALRAALRRYLDLVPEDDAAQMEFFRSWFDEMETVDQKLETIEQVLTSRKGRQLAAPLRSRLASFAALAAEELGDIGRVAKWLKVALELDSTNGEAAEFMYRLALDRNASPEAKAQAAVRWVRAAPARSSSRYALAKSLMELGVFERASDQFEMGTRLSYEAAKPNVIQAWVYCLAAAGLVDDAMGLFDMLEQQFKHQFQGADTAGAEFGYLSTDLELLRLAILSVHGGADEGSQSFAVIRSIFEPLIEENTAEPDAQPVASTQSVSDLVDAEKEEPNLSGLTLAWIAAVFGQNLDLVDDWIGPTLRDHSLAKRALGWQALQRGDSKTARRLLESIKETDDFALLGLARLEATRADQDKMLVEVAQRFNAQMPSLMAQIELNKLEVEVPISRAVASIVQEVERWPRRVWKTNFSRSRWISTKFEVTPVRVGYLEPLFGHITIRNLSGIPLAIGPREGVPSLLQVSVLPSIEGRTMSQIHGMYVDLWRQLVLGATEHIKISFRLDRSGLGDVFARHPFSPVVIQARAMLDPVLGAEGTLRTRVTGGTDSVRAIQRWSLGVTDEHVEQCFADLETGTEIKQMAAVSRLFVLATGFSGDIDTDTESFRLRVTDTINKRFAEFDPSGKAWTINLLPQEDEELRSDLQRLEDLARRSDDPLVRVVYLATFVRDLDSPELTSAIRHEDPRIHGFGKAMKTALEIEAKKHAEQEKQGTLIVEEQ